MGRGRVYFLSDSLDGALVGDAVFFENRNAAAPATMKKTKMATMIDRFTFVVRRCTFTSGNPLLSLSIDI